MAKSHVKAGHRRELLPSEAKSEWDVFGSNSPVTGTFDLRLNKTSIQSSKLGEIAKNISRRRLPESTR